MSLQTTGTLHRVFPTKLKTDTFQAREFILEVQDGNYPQLVKFQLVQDRCGLIDNYAEGQEITVHFDLRGREWEGKYFTNLNAWRIEQALISGEGSSEKPRGTITPAEPAPEPEDEKAVAESESSDGLPF